MLADLELLIFFWNHRTFSTQHVEGRSMKRWWHMSWRLCPKMTAVRAHSKCGEVSASVAAIGCIS